jgi:crossover junction endodeoxyribonuclease RuvC
MIVAGLDLSLTSTGLVVLGSDVATDVKPWLVHERRIASKLRGLERLHEISDLIVDELHEWGISDLAIEGYSFNSRASQSHALGELGGVVRLRLSLAGFAFWNVPPATLKKFVCAKGNAPKEVMMRETFRRWGYDNDSPDLVDAYGLARMVAAHHHGFERKSDEAAWSGATKKGKPAVERVEAIGTKRVHGRLVQNINEPVDEASLARRLHEAAQ